MPARIPEITAREELPEGQRHIWDAIAASRGSVRGPFRVLLHSPELAARAAHLGAYVRFEGQLSAYVRELAVLIGARLLECDYEYAAHQPQAREAGVTDEVIAAIDARHPEGLPPDDRWIYALVEQALLEHRVSPETLALAQERLGVVGLVELVGTIGYYAMLAATLNAFEVTPER